MKLHQQRKPTPNGGGQDNWRLSQRPPRKEHKQRLVFSSTPPTSFGTRNCRIPKPHGACLLLGRPAKNFSPTRTFEPPFLRSSIRSLITRQKCVRVILVKGNAPEERGASLLTSLSTRYPSQKKTELRSSSRKGTGAVTKPPENQAAGKEGPRMLLQFLSHW